MKHSVAVIAPVLLALGGVAGTLGTAATRAAAATLPFDTRYPYHSAAFTRFVADSYRAAGTGKPDAFYRWMDHARQRGAAPFSATNGDWSGVLAAERRALARLADPAARAQREIALCVRLHRTIKMIIPRFSLDRGFEFTNTVKFGERQCFLQSVTIAGMLQSMDIEAGVVMVNHNIAGQPTNNGHAVTLVRLANGQDVLVDASDPEPFAKQRGLFVAMPGGEDAYVAPVYALNSAKIPTFTLVRGNRRITPRLVGPLPVAFLRSQFDYYRGERAPGGILAKNKTTAGLEASARFLRAAVREYPRNPLAVYQLGRVYVRQSKTEAARAQFASALRLYQGFGWVPPGARGEAMAAAQARIAVQ